MPKQRNIGLEGLYAAVARAESTGHTDEEQKTIDLSRKLADSIVNLVNDYADHNDGLGGLTAPQISKVLAGVIAAVIDKSSPDVISSLDLLAEINMLVLGTILGIKR